MRRVARESVFKLVFEYSFLGAANEDTLELMAIGSDLDDDDKQYITNVYAGVMCQEQQLKDIISQNLEGYTIERVYRPDYAVLLLATYELVNMKEIPVAVVINEAVTLSKKYGTDKSGKFVNGVLAKIAKNLN